MIKLKNVRLNMYKTIETEQCFEVEPNITVLVGQNESGKTAILEVLTKSNPYLVDQHNLDIDRDYPRKLQRHSETRAPGVTVFAGTFALSDDIVEQIQSKVGQTNFNQKDVLVTRRYDSAALEIADLEVDDTAFLNQMFTFSKIEDDSEYREGLLEALSSSDFDPILTTLTDDGQLDLVELINCVFVDNADSEHPIRDYITQECIVPYLPKFLYYDEYYQLPPEINVYELRHNQPVSREAKTSQALVELAGLEIDLLLGDDDEKVERALEDASHQLTTTLRTYWKRDDAPRIILRMSKASIQRGQPALIIRVENDEDEGGLPLESRSKGFKYFFSFMVWFSKIQEDEDVDYVLLLDEPGLSLHGTAQADLLGFFEDLAKTYQIIYTTHSQFMIDFTRLNRVRTVSKKGNQSGTQVSANLNDGDRDALLLLQAALGYNIVQSLFIGENNLIVEGFSDYLYLQTMSSILRTHGRSGLSPSITIVPLGGVDKAASFIALFRGNGLDIVCLLDTIGDSSGKQRIDDLIQREIIQAKNVRYYNEFAANGANEADIEDVFAKCEYLQLYNGAFEDRRDIDISELDEGISRVTQQIRKILKKHYNHTRPAKYFARTGDEQEFLSQETLERFEKMFKEINKRFKK